MERFVFIAAVTCAILFAAVVWLGGHGDVKIEFDGPGRAPLVEVGAGRMEARTFQGAGLSIRHTAARIVITPEQRADFSIEIENPGHAPMPEVSAKDGRVVIDGRLRGRLADCLADGGASLVGYGDFAAADLPLIIIHTPRALALAVGGASTTEIGPAQSLELDFNGCGAARLGAVEQRLDVDFAGSGRVEGAAAGELNADLAGSGELAMGQVANGANIDLAGSGRVTIASLNGDLRADSAGSGGVGVGGGVIGAADIDLAGSGGVEINAPVERLRASILGSGGVSVHSMVGQIDADIAGSGEVRALAVTGAIRKDVAGSGDVHVGE